MQLENRVAAVSGGTAGIGRAIAEAFLKEGARVAIMARNAEKGAKVIEEIGAGDKLIFVQGDATNQADVEGFIDQTVSTFGGIDILVNNAGGAGGDLQPAVLLTDDEFDFCMKVNVYSTFWATRRALKTMLENKWGRIINISSVAARGGLHYQAGYSASKSGVLGLTHTVTLEYARFGVTCNAVLPGVIETENVKAMPKAVSESVKAMVPARRLGQVDEVAHLVAFLASEEAGFISGAEIDIDGGTRLNALTLGSRAELKERADALARAFD